MRRLYPDVPPVSPGQDWLAAIQFDEWFWCKHQLDFGQLTAELRTVDAMVPAGTLIASLATPDETIVRRENWALILTVTAAQTAKIIGSVAFVAFEFTHQLSGRQTVIPGRWVWPVASREVTQ